MGEQGALEFQINDWNNYHEVYDECDERYVIQLFGRTEDDKDVCLKVTGFCPYFYIEIPETWSTTRTDKFIVDLKSKVKWYCENNSYCNKDCIASPESIADSLINYGLVQKHKFYNFTNKKMFNFIMLVFKSHNAMKCYSNVLSRPFHARSVTKAKMLYQRYESNIEPHIRFMHINNLSSCGWANIDRSKLIDARSYSDCDHSYIVDWKDVKPASNDDRMAPFKIMGYDIECISCDHNFPQADRKTDKIIQIGMTMYRYGSMNCYEQHMLTLGRCAPIKNAHVECHKSEKGLIRAWARKVKEIRPDYMAGYYNSNFDDNFIYNRIMRIDKEAADERGISVNDLENKFIDEILNILGKVNNEYLIQNEGLCRSLTKFEVKNLSSSALGDNELKFFQIPGVIFIDMMKVIQRDHRLIGYKLDNVSANFITESATKFVEGNIVNGHVQVDIYTKSTKALEKDAYIQIMVDDGYSSSPLREGAKYKVNDIQTITEKKYNKDKKIDEIFEYQCIKTSILEKDIPSLREAIVNPLLKIFWTFAKDDMHHTLINKYFNEGNLIKIRRVAKYCLKDCKLVNLLLAKLEIIVNSIGMAKVCHVPLSYLFLRGQGVKIFSLVSKKCKEKNYLIPVLRRNKKDNNGDEDETYEGATVITPKPDVYLSPIGVLDYSSLYPNSMRERNLSQECYVNDPKYDNLPGYIYHDVFIVLKDKKGKIIRNLDGTPKKDHHRFAQELITDEQINVELKDIISNVKSNINEITKAVNFTESYIERLKSIVKTKIDKLEDQSTNPKLIKLQDRLTKINPSNTISTLEKEMLIDEEKAKIQMEKAKVYNVVDGKTVKYGILPEILTELLNKRKDTNAKLAKEIDPFKKAILNALQLAFKITANSLYGQTGAPTSPIFFIAIAASTTAVGRERLHFAKKIVEENFKGSEVIYGDTDSIFINFHLRDDNGAERTDESALIETIELCKKAASLINKCVPKPQSIIYEKTFFPFILVAKKKYVGLLFEKDHTKYYLKSMGIVLKRRDNAPIVKIVVGGIIDYLLKNRDINKAIDYTKQVIRKIMDNKYPIDKFIISKTLKAKYKKPSTIAHKVLADRMAIRDPGNKPQINDRIPFVYVVKNIDKRKKKDILQGDLIEHPDYVLENKLKIDYLYYLEHQIINPASQILELLMPTKNVERLFREFIIIEENKRKGCQSMEKWIDKSRSIGDRKFAGSKVIKEPHISLKKAKPVDNHLPIGKKVKVENLSIEKWLERQPVPVPVTASAPSKTRSRKKEIKCCTINRWISKTAVNSIDDDWRPELD